MLASLSIKSKLRTGIAALLVFMAMVVGTSTYVISELRGSAREVGSVWMPSLDLLGEFSADLAGMRTNSMGLAIFTEQETRDRARARLRTVRQEIETSWNAYLPLVTAGEERRMADSISARLRAYWPMFDAQMALADAGKTEELAAALQSSRQHFFDLLDELSRLRSYKSREGAKAAQAAEATGWTGTLVILGVGLVAVLMGIAIAWMLGLAIAARIVALSGTLDRLAKRDYGFDLPQAADKDEIGTMARAIAQCRDGLKEADRLAAAEVEEAKKRATRAERIDTLVKTFEEQASAVLRTVSSAATELSATAATMSETAEDGTRQATVVAAASEQASMNVQTVASSTEELAASIAEVARQVRDTAGITNRAADSARETDATVRGLAEAANKIGDVVRLISDIAGQTNLLALNATIEAARAGEAGKGFAVVASEVKNLATQTAKATEEIAAQINAMQTETGRTVEAIASIARTIEELNANTAQVAAASEQQAAATQEIGRAVAEAAQGTQEASRSAIGVKEGAERTGGAAEDLRGASTELAQQSERLRAQVDGFLAGIRAA